MGGPPKSGPIGLASLSRREREVFCLVIQGVSMVEAGLRLGISRRTAECHRHNIQKKLGAQSPIDWLLEARLVAPEAPKTADDAWWGGPPAHEHNVPKARRAA